MYSTHMIVVRFIHSVKVCISGLYVTQVHMNHNHEA